MPPHVHVASDSQAFPLWLTLALLLGASLYVRGWLHLRSTSATVIPAWRASSFHFGLLLIWAALGSSVASYDHELLTFHMVQHLLLMTFAPALILLGEPIQAFWNGGPQFARNALVRIFVCPSVYRLARMLTKPALCWSASALTLVGWHIPTLFTLGLKSEMWHSTEQASFLGAGLLFWWPVVRPWPSSSALPQWSILLYLFFATLPCDILSGFLVFSDRVAYPVYSSMPQHFGFSVLADQQCAGALMWTCVTAIYLVPAAILTTRLLLPTSCRREKSLQSDLGRVAVPHRDHKAWRSLEYGN